MLKNLLQKKNDIWNLQNMLFKPVEMKLSV